MYNIIRTSARSTRKTLKLSVLSVICVQTTSIVKEHKCKDTTFFAEIQIIYQLFVSRPVFSPQSFGRIRKKRNFAAVLLTS